MSRSSRLVAALCAVTVLAAAACSDDDGTDTTEATGATETSDGAVTTAAPTTAAATTATTAAPATTEAPTAATDAPTTEAPTTVASIGSIVDVAGEAGTFTTLLAAAEAAGMTEELTTRNITLLAPTDDAFAALGQDTVDALLADPVALTALLRNHMLPVPQDADAIRLFNNVLTVDATSLPVVVDGDTLTIGGATVVTPDVAADNGVIHAIDTVLVPAAPPAG